MTARVPAGARPGGRFLLLAALAGLLVGAAPVAPEPAAEEPTKGERAGLAYLHRHAVKLFIDQTGFGFSRMEPPLTDVLAPPKSQADLPRGGPQVAELPEAIRTGADAKKAHYSFARAVGEVAYVPPPAGVKNKAWVVKEVRLVGLVKNPEPVVYLTGGAAEAGMKKGKAEVKTRRPDEFESKALEVIRGGGELVQAERRDGALRAVSGIYAGRQCAKCHERPGEMLGAFSYRLALEDAKGLAGVDGVPIQP
ncbi:MAG TPA: hypothetical protein VD866_18785 [Urbifossiella sp.]|nr:hypothetical protein [Urbifossiella sp.]